VPTSALHPNSEFVATNSKLLYDIFGTAELLPLEGQRGVIALLIQSARSGHPKEQATEETNVEYRELAAVFEAIEESGGIVHLEKLLYRSDIVSVLAPQEGHPAKVIALPVGERPAHDA
jgi:hypothetical protein